MIYKKKRRENRRKSAGQKNKHAVFRAACASTLFLLFSALFYTFISFSFLSYREEKRCRKRTRSVKTSCVKVMLRCHCVSPVGETERLRKESRIEENEGEEATNRARRANCQNDQLTNNLNSAASRNRVIAPIKQIKC